ncbi:hypothetical protein AV530_008181 [Patagioenas fasciata monilis]|uniref:Uncharacterized protein n=1 Tax=Patagioenas fasciata monilis TaxID=372326 RepID=A0A1V4KUS9_PATFA|nr:hypothetical protein AV530_008181 [Patagioenas fasciata monilis]
MPKTKKNWLYWDKRTLVALAGDAEREEFWGKSSAMAVLADALIKVFEDNLEQQSSFPPKKLEKETPMPSSLD